MTQTNDYKQLIQLLKQASDLARNNVKNADNIDLYDMFEQLNNYIDELKAIKQFEVYDED